MKVFVHEGKGHWIGSAAVCLAESQEQAEKVIRGYLDSAGLKGEPLNVRERRSDIPGVVFFDDGDY